MRKEVGVLLIVGVFGSWAQGQVAGSGVRNNSIGYLLFNKSVQEELKLDKQQGNKAVAVVENVYNDNRDLVEKLRDRSTPVSDKNEIRHKLNEASYAALKDILTKEQSRRLREIQLQHTGAEAFEDVEVVKKLSLNESQVKDVRTILEEARAKRQALFIPGQPPPGRVADKLLSIEAEAVGRLLNTLTREQKKTWGEMTGTPFEFIIDGRPR